MGGIPWKGKTFRLWKHPPTALAVEESDAGSGGAVAPDGGPFCLADRLSLGLESRADRQPAMPREPRRRLDAPGVGSQTAGMERAVFLDRDGTLNAERNYLCDPAELELLPGVPEALRRLRTAGCRLVIVTNQSGIGRGYYTEADMHRVNQRLCEFLAPHGVGFDRIYFAPEAPDQPSRGRKPSPQFLLDARDELGLDLGRSYMIGDKLIDLECGWNAGVRCSILVRTGYGAEVERLLVAPAGPVAVVDGLTEAAQHILTDS